MRFFFVLIFFIFLNPFLFSSDEYPNSVFFGVGGGYNLEAKHTEFSLMGGYNRHFGGTPTFTLGILGEGVFSEHSFFLLGLPIGFYPVESLKLWLAPCYSLRGGGKEYFHSEDDGEEHFRTNSEFILKFGFGYNYHFHDTRVSMLPFIEGSVMGSEFILGIGIKFNFYFTDSFR